MLTGVVLYRSCVVSHIVKVSWRSFPIMLRRYHLEVGALVLCIFQTFCPSSAMYLSLAEYPTVTESPCFGLVGISIKAFKSCRETYLMRGESCTQVWVMGKLSI